MSNLERYSSYKNSGVEWIGQIPEHWEVRKLKTFSSFVNRGSTPSYVEKSDVYIINQATFSKGYLDLKNIKYTDETVDNFYKNRGRVFTNDLLIASTGGGVLGKVLYFDLDKGNFIADSHVTMIRTNNNAINKFYFYFLQNNYELINGILAQGSTNQTELQKSWLMNFLLPFPPKQEQIKIASFLDTKTEQLDKAIKQKEQLIELLKERRAILINDAVTKGITKETPDSRFDKTVAMKDSGVKWIGDIPKGWEITKLGAISEIKSDKNHPKYEVLSVYRDYGVVIKSSRDDNHNATSLDTSTYKAVDIGDLVVNKMKAWQGFMGISPHKGIVSPAYITCKIKSNILKNNYLHTLIRTHLYIGEYNRISYGVRIGQWDMRYEDFKQIPILIPPKQEQHQIIDFIENQTSKIDNAINLQQKQIKKLKEYKTTLIDSVVTGKVRVA